MKKLMCSVCVLLLIAMICSLTAFAGRKKAAPPAIEMGKFINTPLFSSPPWYPDECSDERDSYRWAPRICWADADPSIDINVYTGEEPISATFSAIAAGFTTWDAGTTAVLYGTITEDSSSNSWPGVSQDFENTVSWAGMDGPGGIIGVTYYWYYTATKELVEFDMVLDREEDWSFDGSGETFSVQNIVTHEAGHTLVLQDLRSPKDGALTMHAYTWPGDVDKEILGSGDILGLQEIYGE